MIPSIVWNPSHFSSHGTIYGCIMTWFVLMIDIFWKLSNSCLIKEFLSRTCADSLKNAVLLLLESKRNSKFEEQIMPDFFYDHKILRSGEDLRDPECAVVGLLLYTRQNPIIVTSHLET